MGKGQHFPPLPPPSALTPTRPASRCAHAAQRFRCNDRRTYIGMRHDIRSLTRRYAPWEAGSTTSSSAATCSLTGLCPACCRPSSGSLASFTPRPSSQVPLMLPPSASLFASFCLAFYQCFVGSCHHSFCQCFCLLLPCLAHATRRSVVMRQFSSHYPPRLKARE